jgi:hypothetical protein
MPSYDTLKPVFKNEEKAISFLYQHSAVYKERNCPKCEKNDIEHGEKDIQMFEGYLQMSHIPF